MSTTLFSASMRSIFLFASKKNEAFSDVMVPLLVVDLHVAARGRCAGRSCAPRAARCFDCIGILRCRRRVALVLYSSVRTLPRAVIRSPAPCTCSSCEKTRVRLLPRAHVAAEDGDLVRLAHRHHVGVDEHRLAGRKDFVGSALGAPHRCRFRHELRDHCAGRLRGPRARRELDQLRLQRLPVRDDRRIEAGHRAVSTTLSFGMS